MDPPASIDFRALPSLSTALGFVVCVCLCVILFDFFLNKIIAFVHHNVVASKKYNGEPDQ